MGGAPIDRASKQNKVEQIAQLFEEREEFRLAIAPEGTRENVDKWKSGFYYIALQAKVPIAPVGFDHANKSVIFFDAFKPTGNYEKDYAFLRNLFKHIEPRKK